ncbi:MAG: helix-turn-helix domain-containing protein [Clostridia bacterium]|nr:helix-turn-helix domain-containing protein [Clostridia bacterium]
MPSAEITKYLQLSIDSPEQLSKVCHALSTELRLGIIKNLTRRGMRVNELAQAMGQPLSTIALNVRILEEAGLITTELRAGARGAMKLCFRCVDQLDITLFRPQRMERLANELVISLDVGSYSECQVERTCGIVSDTGYIGVEDDPRSFYLPEHTQAQHLWFREGYLEYRFPVMLPSGAKVTYLDCSLEICSEAPYYRNDWPSDITLWINGHEITTWRSPGDFGGRRGQFCPAWWPDSATQFGLLKSWQVNEMGTFAMGTQVSETTLSELDLYSGSYVTLRIGIKPDAECKGGVSLFGKHFGDYNQPILITLGYVVPNDKSDK